MKKLILLLTIIFSQFTFAQETKELSNTISTETIYEKVDKDAEFPGGLNAFRNFIMNIWNFDKIKGSGKFTSIANFVVDKTGVIVDINVTGDNKSLNKELLRTISLIKTKWYPAIKNGESVNQRFKFPMTMSFE